MKAGIFTLVALLAFAGNSVLCRVALGEEQIDAAGFTAVRLISAALFLYLLFSFKRIEKPLLSYGHWWSSLMLFIYAICFSFAYLTLDTGTGALILFGSVQICMFTVSKLSGERFSSLELIGLAMAVIGFIYLVLPTLSTPSLSGFVLMAMSGIAWGFYTLAGKKSLQPSLDTTMNFIRTIPMAMITLLFIDFSSITNKGLVVAILSGIVTSGIGYIIWYKALPLLSNMQAAVTQLLVPVIAAFGGLVFISEPISMRLVVASILVLGGVLLVVIAKTKNSQVN
ncbi:DMT family transporter [Pseudoalteromonas phenolica]|uniref:DMT family transporter n=1 Tax=Pseudoalteromonas phenolica TaxID=161398 RepID=UPI00384C0A6E